MALRHFLLGRVSDQENGLQAVKGNHELVHILVGLDQRVELLPDDTVLVVEYHICLEGLAGFRDGLTRLAERGGRNFLEKEDGQFRELLPLRELCVFSLLLDEVKVL